MGFDFQNFGIGLLAGWATAYGVYRVRSYISAGVEGVRGQARTARNYVTRSADGRYLGDLADFCQSSHLAGELVPLSDILVEPRFIPAPELIGVGEEVTRSVFRVVPRVFDHPYLHAPYNIETLSLAELVAGERKIAILGLPGSGRTTALQALVLWSLGEVTFQPPPDRVQERLTAEEAALDEENRAERIKERVSTEERAKERLAKEKGLNIAEAEASLGETRIEAFRRLIPFYLHMANVTVSAQEFGTKVDPAEPLVRAVQHQLGRVTGSSVPLYIYKRLGKGQAALLIDGCDEIPEAERPAKLAWLKALMEAYPENYFIVVGSPQGYGTLSHLGFTPVFLRPWSDIDIEHAAAKWAKAYPYIAGTRRKPASAPDESRIRRALTQSRALTPFELTLKIWGIYADDKDATSAEGWLRRYISRHLPKDQPIGVVLPQLAGIAALQLEDGFITQVRMEALLGDLFAPVEAEAEKAKGKTKDKKAQEREEASAQARFLRMLRRAGLVNRYRGERYQLRYPLLTAYLASLNLKDLTEEELANKALDTRWNRAFAYAAMHTNLEPAVRARLSEPSDVLQTNLLEVSSWLAHAPLDITWRGGIINQLGNLLAAQNQYPLLRERITAALISTRDSMVLDIFKRAAQDANPDVQRLACLGIGALKDPAGLSELQTMLQDSMGDVQLAAGLALGALGSDEALEAMAVALTSGSEQLRKAIAEAFAALPEEGYPVLYDAISHADMAVRRAAVFGLRRINTNWALVAVYKSFLDDSQWYVRSAAQEAFVQMSYKEANGPTKYPPANELPWLETWAAKRGQDLASPELGEQMLAQGLQEGDAQIKAMAAIALGQLGRVDSINPLYAALVDRQENVRAAAHRALGDLQMYIGEPLLSPS
ncbi:MAG: HEAT repeat domain-containing protein [Anaerolineae bacterium]